MNHYFDICICQNGFIVRPAGDSARQMGGSLSTSHVFRTTDQMTRYFEREAKECAK